MYMKVSIEFKYIYMLIALSIRLAMEGVSVYIEYAYVWRKCIKGKVRVSNLVRTKGVLMKTKHL